MAANVAALALDVHERVASVNVVVVGHLVVIGAERGIATLRGHLNIGLLRLAVIRVLRRVKRNGNGCLGDGIGIAHNLEAGRTTADVVALAVHDHGGGANVGIVLEVGELVVVIRERPERNGGFEDIVIHDLRCHIGDALTRVRLARNRNAYASIADALLRDGERSRNVGGNRIVGTIVLHDGSNIGASVERLAVRIETCVVLNAIVNGVLYIVVRDVSFVFLVRRGNHRVASLGDELGLQRVTVVDKFARCAHGVDCALLDDIFELVRDGIRIRLTLDAPETQRVLLGIDGERHALVSLFPLVAVLVFDDVIVICDSCGGIALILCRYALDWCGVVLACEDVVLCCDVECLEGALELVHSPVRALGNLFERLAGGLDNLVLLVKLLVGPNAALDGHFFARLVPSVVRFAAVLFVVEDAARHLHGSEVVANTTAAVVAEDAARSCVGELTTGDRHIVDVKHVHDATTVERSIGYVERTVVIVLHVVVAAGEGATIDGERRIRRLCRRVVPAVGDKCGLRALGGKRSTVDSGRSLVQHDVAEFVAFLLEGAALDVERSADLVNHRAHVLVVGACRNYGALRGVTAVLDGKRSLVSDGIGAVGRNRVPIEVEGKRLARGERYGLRRVGDHSDSVARRGVCDGALEGGIGQRVATTHDARNDGPNRKRAAVVNSSVGHRRAAYVHDLNVEVLVDVCFVVRMVQYVHALARRETEFRDVKVGVKELFVPLGGLGEVLVRNFKHFGALRVLHLKRDIVHEAAICARVLVCDDTQLQIQVTARLDVVLNKVLHDLLKGHVVIPGLPEVVVLHVVLCNLVLRDFEGNHLARGCLIGELNRDGSDAVVLAERDAKRSDCVVVLPLNVRAVNSDVALLVEQHGNVLVEGATGDEPVDAVLVILLDDDHGIFVFRRGLELTACNVNAELANVVLLRIGNGERDSALHVSVGDVHLDVVLCGVLRHGNAYASRRGAAAVGCEAVRAPALDGATRHVERAGADLDAGARLAHRMLGLNDGAVLDVDGSHAVESNTNVGLVGSVNRAFDVNLDVVVRVLEVARYKQDALHGAIDGNVHGVSDVRITRVGTEYVQAVGRAFERNALADVESALLGCRSVIGRVLIADLNRRLVASSCRDCSRNRLVVLILGAVCDVQRALVQAQVIRGVDVVPVKIEREVASRHILLGEVGVLAQRQR